MGKVELRTDDYEIEVCIGLLESGAAVLSRSVALVHEGRLDPSGDLFAG